MAWDGMVWHGMLWDGDGDGIYELVSMAGWLASLWLMVGFFFNSFSFFGFSSTYEYVRFGVDGFRGICNELAGLIGGFFLGGGVGGLGFLV